MTQLSAVCRSVHHQRKMSTSRYYKAKYPLWNKNCPNAMNKSTNCLTPTKNYPNRTSWCIDRTCSWRTRQNWPKRNSFSLRRIRLWFRIFRDSFKRLGICSLSTLWNWSRPKTFYNYILLLLSAVPSLIVHKGLKKIFRPSLRSHLSKNQTAFQESSLSTSAWLKSNKPLRSLKLSLRSIIKGNMKASHNRLETTVNC